MLKSLFTSLVAALLVVLATTASAADKEPLRIAVIDPMTGPMAIAGLPYLAQVEFDAARINKAGGINGHPVEIIAMDNKVSPKESLVQLQKAIDSGVQYIAQGTGSSVGSALLNAVEKHNRRNPDDRLLYLNYGSVEPSFTNERCSFWHFRFDANADMKMKVLTDWIAEQKDIHKVFLINQDYSFGHSVSDSAHEMLTKKRPDIEIVGDVFHPLGKVKDFSPYVSKIKASGADAIITGNWGQDIVLLVKAAADYGVDIPILSYYGNNPGTVSQVGDKGVGRIYVVSEFNGDFTDPDMAQREEAMYQQKEWDYLFLRVADMLDMLQLAAEKADSIDPTKVAFALEGLQEESPTGLATMRAKDHQIQMPMFISVLQDNMEHGAEGTEYNFHAIAKFPAEKVTMPTTCRMQRPEQ